MAEEILMSELNALQKQIDRLEKSNERFECAVSKVNILYDCHKTRRIKELIHYGVTILLAVLFGIKNV